MKSNKIEPFIFNSALSTHRDNRHCQRWIFPSEISPQLINYLENRPQRNSCHRSVHAMAGGLESWSQDRQHDDGLLFIHFLGTDFATWHMPQLLGSDHNCSRWHNNVWTVYYLQFSRHAFNHCVCSISVFFQLTYCICCINYTQRCFATLIIWLLLCLAHVPVEWRLLLCYIVYKKWENGNCQKIDVWKEIFKWY